MKVLKSKPLAKVRQNFSQAHRELNQKIKPRYNLLFNNGEWGLMELEARITNTIEETSNEATFKVPLIDIIDSGIPGGLLGRHSIRCVERMGFLCSKINWVPRFVTVRTWDLRKPNIPLTEGEKNVDMPKRVFQPWHWKEPVELYSTFHLDFQVDCESFWEENFNLIHSCPGVGVTVLKLSQQNPKVPGLEAVQILNRALQVVTRGKKQTVSVDWVPSDLDVTRL